LISEDNEPILKLVSTVVKRLGYDVVSARTPDDALLEAAALKGGISLHIADVNMPGLDGRDLHKRIMESSPRAKCILISGYPKEHLESFGGIPAWADFLQKPFSAADLSAKLRKALGEAS